MSKSKFPADKILMWIAAMLGLALVALGVFGNNGIITYTQLRRSYNDMQIRIEKLDRENEKMAGEIELLKNDPEYIEHIAREELGMIKPGEILYRMQRGGQ